MTEHDSLRLARGSGRVDQRAALIGFLGADDVIELCIGLVAAQLHELGPLRVSNVCIAIVSFQLEDYLKLPSKHT